MPSSWRILGSSKFRIKVRAMRGVSLCNYILHQDGQNISLMRLLGHFPQPFWANWLEHITFQRGMQQQQQQMLKQIFCEGFFTFSWTSQNCPSLRIQLRWLPLHRVYHQKDLVPTTLSTLSRLSCWLALNWNGSIFSRLSEDVKWCRT